MRVRARGHGLRCASLAMVVCGGPAPMAEAETARRAGGSVCGHTAPVHVALQTATADWGAEGGGRGARPGARAWAWHSAGGHCQGGYDGRRGGGEMTKCARCVCPRLGAGSRSCLNRSKCLHALEEVMQGGGAGSRERRHQTWSCRRAWGVRPR